MANLNAGGGGGGAGAAGSAANNTGTAGAGGTGNVYSTTGSNVTYGSGGGGAVATGGTAGTAGAGAGAGSNSGSGTAGTAGTGGGGGGGTTGFGGGAGGSGTAVVSYPAPAKFTGGSVSTVSGNVVHVFTSSGTLTPLQPAISPSTLTFTAGTAFSQTLSATGGTGPYAWSVSVGSLPAGISLNGGTGAITGTPTDPGGSSYSFTIQVQDSAGNRGTQAYTGTLVTPAAQISNSLRFRSSASASLSRTFASAGDQKTWTFSTWFKRGSSVSGGMEFIGIQPDSNNYSEIWFSGTNQIRVVKYEASTQVWGTWTEAVLVDPAAWYHLVVAFDTTQAVDSNRVKIYINGVQQVTSKPPGWIAQFPAQNSTTLLNGSGLVGLGALTLFGSMASPFFDGYMAEVNFIDGQALTASSFGQTNTTTGVWEPIAYSGTYGTNGFYLPFNDGTTTTTLCADASGNSNNWTPNNISLTAGATYDWMIDSPTPYAGSSYGVGNYCVLNPLSAVNATLSNGDLTFSGALAGASGTISIASSEKFYFEGYPTNIQNGLPGTSCFQFGVTNPSTGVIVATYLSQGTFTVDNATEVVGTRPTYTNGDVIGVAADFSAKTVTFYKNNVSVGTATWTGTYSDPVFQLGTRDVTSITQTANVNFGQQPFTYTPPAGYKSLCTYNLPTPAIVNGADYMMASLYSGTGATQTISGLNYSPDLVWIKDRTNTNNNELTDTVRGATKALVSNSTAAESTDTNGLTAFTSTGFTVGSQGSYNASGDNFVAWSWDAGTGSPATNTAGSITSQVLANPTAGFSIVSYTGNFAASASVGHGLGAAPSLIIVKDRDVANDWPVYSSYLNGGTTPQNYWQILNGTNAQMNLGSIWGTSAPTSSVFNLSVYAVNNGSGANFVAYCWAAIPGFSAFGSYTGNGSSNGPFIYTGFRPRWVMIKRTDAATNWYIYDTARSTYNLAVNELNPNASFAETVNTIGNDILSNGIKWTTGDGAFNASSGTYIYAAFAENPFKYALAR